MILKELTLRRKNFQSKEFTQYKTFDRWNNVTSATSRLITYILLTRKEL